MTKEKVHRRFKNILEHLEFTKDKTEFSKHIGVGRVSLDGNYNGSMPSLLTISKLATTYKHDINCTWLLTGDGDMIPVNENHSPMNNQNTDNRIPEERLSFLEELKHKDERIITLQSEVSDLKQEIISMLKKQLKEKPI